MRWLVLGGRRREGEAAAWLAARGHEVAAWGCGLPPEAASLECADPEAALARADAVLLPALGPGPAEIEVLRGAPPGLPLLAGRPGALGLANGSRVLLYGDAAEYRIGNAVPTAEAAIWEATGLAGLTASEARCLVLGYGCCGAAVGRRLLALGARVVALDRAAAARAQAAADGCDAVANRGLEVVARGAQIVWNTIPEAILGRAALASLAPGAVVLDIASSPGGTDFAAAAECGVRAVLAGALPERHFPRTAGAIIGRVALRMAGGEC